MNFYKVLVGDYRFHGKEPLTYNSEADLQTGSIVSVPLRTRTMPGIILEKISRPGFATKSVGQVLTPTPLPATSLGLISWLQGYYPAPPGVIASQFLPASLLKKARKKLDENVTKRTIQTLAALTNEQASVIKKITSSKQKTFLLHGDTGTGKTRVYMELAQKELQAGRSVVILTPEISLTPQLIKDFEAVFGNQVILLHSSLTESARRLAWLNVLQAEVPIIVIGPRSALFAPFKNLGLVVVDEAHETAYKQEQSPHYQAGRVASKLAQLHKALLVFGTATPTISEYFIAQAKNIPILRMQKLAVGDNSAQPELRVVTGQDRSQFTRHSYISDPLIEEIENALRRGEQSLIFLNRRGTARLVLCQNCGWQALCPVCDLPLTYHGDSHTMRCHTCGHSEPAVSVCPVCGSADIIFKSIGTKSLTESLRHLFPEARIQRFDTDNKKSERLEEHYQQLADGGIDIVVGTQILAKGLDLPKLGLVGVVAADTSLYFPDYTAEERTFQLLSQVIGRIGRGHRAGHAVIQTYNPESAAIRAALTKDWDNFYQSQLKERELFLFPPYCYLLKLTCTRKTSKGATTAAKNLLGELQKLKLKVQIIGPSPAFREKVAGGYRWQLVAKTKNRGELLKIVAALPAGWTYDLDPANLL
jgi:primosomal protein N' (replication factor Y)